MEEWSPFIGSLGSLLVLLSHGCLRGNRLVSSLGLEINCGTSLPLGMPVFALGGKEYFDRRLIAGFQQIANQERTLWYEWGCCKRECTGSRERGCCTVIPLVDWWVDPLYLLFTRADGMHSSYSWSYKMPITWRNSFQHMTFVFLSETPYHKVKKYNRSLGLLTICYRIV